MTLKPPPLRNDCFALPAGVNWTPVDEALALLKDRLHPVTGQETVGLGAALGHWTPEAEVAEARSLLVAEGLLEPPPTAQPAVLPQPSQSAATHSQRPVQPLLRNTCRAAN